MLSLVPLVRQLVFSQDFRFSFGQDCHHAAPWLESSSEQEKREEKEEILKQEYPSYPLACKAFLYSGQKDWVPLIDFACPALGSTLGLLLG